MAAFKNIEIPSHETTLSSTSTEQERNIQLQKLILGVIEIAMKSEKSAEYIENLMNLTSEKQDILGVIVQ